VNRLSASSTRFVSSNAPGSASRKERDWNTSPRSAGITCSFSPQISDSNAEPPAVKWHTTSHGRPAKCIDCPTAVLGKRPTSFRPRQISFLPVAGSLPSTTFTLFRTCQARSLTLPTDNGGFTVAQIQVTWTQVIALAAGVVLTVGTGTFLRLTKLGTAMRAMANDRDITATLGVPVRKVEAAAWLGCGILGGIAGLLLADLVALDATTLTFLVISSLAAVLIARLRSITVTFVAAIVIGLLHDLLTPIASLTSYRDMTPFVIAAIGLLVLSRHQVMTQSREEA